MLAEFCLTSTAESD